MTTSCGAFYLVKTNDGCYDIAKANNIALDQLYTWNKALSGDCTGLYPTYYICVGLVGSTTTTTSATATTSSGGVSTPTPTQAGMVSSCKSFYYVQSGDSCYDIAASNGIALDTLYDWNPALGGDCSGLWPEYYICVGL
jgi:LysM repeat protein